MILDFVPGPVKCRLIVFRQNSGKFLSITAVKRLCLNLPIQFFQAGLQFENKIPLTGNFPEFVFIQNATLAQQRTFLSLILLQ